MFKIISQGVDITYLPILGPYIQGNDPKVGPGHSAAPDTWISGAETWRTGYLWQMETAYRTASWGTGSTSSMRSSCCCGWSQSCCVS